MYEALDSRENMLKVLEPFESPQEKINQCLTDINRCLTDIFKI